MRRDHIWATERARGLFGLQARDRIDIDDLQSRIYADDYPRVREALQESVHNQSGYRAEFRVGRDEATARWISARGKVESDAHGNVTLVHGVLRDVSDQKKAQAEADELRREVTHSGRITMLGRLSSALAHELSQPLGAILRNVEAAEMMLDRPDPNLDELRAIISDIHKDDQRAGSIIDKLRSLLKRRQMQFQPLSVESLVNDASTLVRADATARHVALRCEAAVALPMISGDRVHLSQVLINLILNGIDSICDSGESSRQVTVAAHAFDASSVEITVADSGGGLAPEALSRLFEPFFTTKPSGMGMGLSVSRTIVEAHGGRLCAENQSNGGALFRVILPAMPMAFA
jgi:C4-dicarboxylate-specific signal transduction histidine kinase